MTPKLSATLVMVLVLAGCNDPYVPTGPSSPEPTGTPPSNPPAASTLHQFTESETGFSTTDLRDAQDEIVQFTTANELVWAADGTRLPGFSVFHISGFSRGVVHFIEGKICTEGCSFEVRFGSKDGERRAYLTVDYGHSNPGTLVDVEVAGATLVVTQTTAYPSGTFTLSGVVTEVTAVGAVRPVTGVVVSRGVTTGWQYATTDATGSYQIHGLNDGIEEVSARKDGYQTTAESVTVKGDTRFNIRLSRP
jgi:hypothetical protein